MNSQKDFQIQDGKIFEKIIPIQGKEAVILIVPYVETEKPDKIHLVIFTAELDSNTRKLSGKPRFIDNKDTLNIPYKDKDLKNLINGQAESIINAIRVHYKKVKKIDQKAFDDMAFEKWLNNPFNELDWNYPDYKDFFESLKTNLDSSNILDYLEDLKENYS